MTQLATSYSADERQAHPAPGQVFEMPVRAPGAMAKAAQPVTLLPKEEAACDAATD